MAVRHKSTFVANEIYYITFTILVVAESLAEDSADSPILLTKQ